MIDERVYCEAFSRLRASDEAKQEVLHQMEIRKNEKKVRPLRAMGMVAAIVAALCVTAGAVNAATGGELFRSFTVTMKGGQMELEDEDGNIVGAFLAGGEVERVDGRLILKAFGREEDITDALERDGFYRMEDELNGLPAAVEVRGDAEEWSVTSTVDGQSVTYSLTAGENGPAAQGDLGEDGSPAVSSEKSASVETRTEITIDK